MSTKVQRVVVIQDASREVSLSAISWAIHGLSLKPGDKLTLLAVLHQVNNPSTLPKMGIGKLLGFKSKVDYDSMFGTNYEIVEKEVARKREEYKHNEEIVKTSEQYAMQKIEFDVKVVAGPSPKEIALQASKDLRATWVILDRQMKKDKKYFMEELSCGISRMKRDNSVEKLRGPKTTETKSHADESRIINVTYDEMLPGPPEEDLFSLELSPTKFQGSSKAISEEEQRWSFNLEEFDDSICSVCNNRRPKIGCKKDFTYAELDDATAGFNKKNYLSEGGFGFVYKGKLRDGLMIAVKQHKDASLQGEKEFKSEVYVLSKARHKNVVMLLGSCSEGNHRLLVYEYVCNGSLDKRLSKNNVKPLSWTDRMRIALGAARGLNHLHENNIIHRDMRPSNILVTHDHEPLLGDFGLARTQHEEIDHSTENIVVGTFGYLAPEYAESGKASTKTDVYSFGVVLLELITGLRTTDKKLEERSLIAWARPLLKARNYPDLIDPRILDSHDVHQLFWMVLVAEKCLKKDTEKRISMDKVVNILTSIMLGETVLCINDFSPSSNVSQGDEETAEQDSLSAEVHSSSSISQTSGLFSSEYSEQTLSTKSSSPSTRSKRSISSSGKNSIKEVVKSRNSRRQIPYGEMLD